MTVRVLSGDDDSIIAGHVWTLLVDVTDDDGYQLSTQTPTVTVTPPTGAAGPAVVTYTDPGRYTAAYTTAVAGRHVAIITTASVGTAAAVAYAGEVTDAASMPDLAAAVAYLGETSATTDEITDALTAESDAQRSAVRIPPVYPAALRQALLRRVARNLAMRGIPLAVLQGDADGGDATVLPGTDPEVRRLERPWRRLTMG